MLLQHYAPFYISLFLIPFLCLLIGCGTTGTYVTEKTSVTVVEPDGTDEYFYYNRANYYQSGYQNPGHPYPVYYQPHHYRPGYYSWGYYQPYSRYR